MCIRGGYRRPDVMFVYLRFCSSPCRLALCVFLCLVGVGEGLFRAQYPGIEVSALCESDHEGTKESVAAISMRLSRVHHGQRADFEIITGHVENVYQSNTKAIRIKHAMKHIFTCTQSCQDCPRTKHSLRRMVSPMNVSKALLPLPPTPYASAQPPNFSATPNYA